MDMAVARGGAAGSEYKNFYRESIIVARMLIGHLNGSVDIDTLAINNTPSFGVAVNLDAAEE